MNDGHKRRHIRDIAHLYISGARYREPAPGLCLVVAGEHKRCFPGFHAANLAAALAVRGCEVRLQERSGLLPNAGFYLALPASRYMRWETPENDTEPGLAGVTVDCATGTLKAFRGESLRAQIDCLHVPPLSSAKPRGEFSVLRGGEPRSLVIVVAVGGEGMRTRIPTEFLGRFNPDAVMLFRTDESDASGHGVDLSKGDTPSETDQGDGSLSAAERSVPEVGRAIGWEAALEDRVPVVVRAPDSGLAGAYLAAADALRFKTDELRRTIVEPVSAESSPGLRPGSVDRGPNGEGTVLPIPRFGARHSRRGSS